MKMILNGNLFPINRSPPCRTPHLDMNDAQQEQSPSQSTCIQAAAILVKPSYSSGQSFFPFCALGFITVVV